MGVWVGGGRLRSGDEIKKRMVVEGFERWFV